MFLADLDRALKQTKIVSCALTPGPVQWKNTGKKFIRGTEELGSLEVFLMNKVCESAVLCFSAYCTALDALLSACLHIGLKYSSTASQCPSLSVIVVVVFLACCNAKRLLRCNVLFVICQVSILNKEENKRDTIVDRVFRKALQEFHMQLISSYSVLMKVRLTE